MLMYSQCKKCHFQWNIYKSKQHTIKLQTVSRLGQYTDKNIFDDSYYVVGNTFPGFPALGEENCLL